MGRGNEALSFSTRIIELQQLDPDFATVLSQAGLESAEARICGAGLGGPQPADTPEGLASCRACGRLDRPAGTGRLLLLPELFELR